MVPRQPRKDYMTPPFAVRIFLGVGDSAPKSKRTVESGD